MQRDKNGKPKLNLTPLYHTAVNPQTQEEYLTLMKVYGYGDWKGYYRSLSTKYNFWDKFKEEFCVDAGISFFNIDKKFGYGNKEYYKAEKWEIIPTQKFYKIEKIPPQIRNKINLEWEIFSFWV